MKITCGTDIIEIERVKESIENLGEKFLERVYTKKEIEYCESKKKQKYQHYAARFAAKEALFKAISWKLEDKYEICWKDIEIIERRTMSTDSREGEKASECDIFFICKKGCTEKEKKKKKRGIIFYTMHRKRIMLIGYSKEREEELRQYWDNEIRDQRK